MDHDGIEKIVNEIRGHQLEILHEFVKARVALESLEGKNIFNLLKNMEIHFQHEHLGFKCWISFKEEN